MPHDCFYIDPQSSALAAVKSPHLADLTPKDRAVVYGVLWLFRTGTDDPAQRNGLLVVDQLQVLKNITGPLARVLGESNAKELAEGHAITIGSSTIGVSTIRKPIQEWHGPALVVFPSPKLLPHVDGIIGLTGEYVVPWMPIQSDAAVREWLTARSAQEIVPARTALQ